LAELPLQYADFAVWQREWLQGGLLDAEAAWWRERLAGAPETLELPADRPRPSVRSLRGRLLTFSFDAGLAAALRALARRRGATLFSTLLAGLQALLVRYTGQSDFLIGSPVASRTRTEVEGLIGFFVNTLVFRAQAACDLSFLDLLGRARESTLSAFEHQDLPFERLVEELRPGRSLSRSPLIQVALALQNTPLPHLELPGLTFAPREAESGTARFDLSVLLRESAAGIEGAIEYSTDLFERPTIGRFAAHLENLLAAAAADPGSRLSELPLLSEAERRQVLFEWNETTSGYPREATIPEVFALRALGKPEAPAVEEGDETLSYGELAQRARRLAHRLRRLGVATEERVGLCLPRTLDQAVAMLGVLEAGGAYVPLDLAYPRERLAFMIADAGVTSLVTEKGLLPDLPAGLDASGLRIVCLDEEESEDGEGEPDRAAGPGADALAYVMYTSGSTGRPKGVAVTHRGVLRLVLDTDYVRLGPAERILQVSNTAFDAATFEIWGALLTGGCVVGIERETVLAPRAFAAELHARRITTLFLTTALFQQIAREVPDAFAPLRSVLFGGEVSDPARVRQAVAGSHRLLHVYGPTEGTTFTTWHPVTAVPEGAATVPIGRPIANTRAVLLDRDLRPVPVGLAGELCAGGDGLARGYLGRPDLTAERFVPDPCSGEPGARLYRSGDLARYRADGVIELVGRIDRQVKIRGFRIEPGEVEAALLADPAVAECVVTARQQDDGERHLVAYVAPAVPGELSVSSLRGLLRGRLPQHMIPRAFVLLPSLPLTPNGKVDRYALPAPDAGALSEREHVAPRNAVEELLAEVWEAVLRVERRVGVHDDFFELGGHSLLAFRLIAEIEKTLGVQIPVRALFEAPSLAALGERVAEEIEREAGDELLAQSWTVGDPVTPSPEEGAV
jgi:amino acid adenylation domain-containing protein